ncbi:hypothetical protein V2J09_003020 [Rumex salicifolius]
MDVKLVNGDCGYELDDIPHLSDYLADLPTYEDPLENNPAYAGVKQYFVDDKDTVIQSVIQQKDGGRGRHFRRAGPRKKVYYKSDDVRACIVTCGGICPGINTVIREIVCSLNYMYGVENIVGIQGGYKGFDDGQTTIPLNPKIVNNIHKKGGSFLGNSRGGEVTSDLVDKIQARNINQVYIIGGRGTQRAASVIYEEIRRRGLHISVICIANSIDSDLPVIDKSFGFDTVVEEAQRALNAAHVEAESAENGIGLVKLMGRRSGFVAINASIANRDVDCCLIPESPFYLEKKGGLFEFVEKQLKENGHMVIVVAAGAIDNVSLVDQTRNAPNDDVGQWLADKIKDYFKTKKKEITLKYIDPTYMISAIPSNGSDNVYCTLLAQSAVHGAMAGYTGFTVGQVNGRQCYIPLRHIIEKRRRVIMTEWIWARLLASTNQPWFGALSHWKHSEGVV